MHSQSLPILTREQSWSTLIQASAELSAILRPPPKLTVSDWADKYRRLSPESSAEPGRWRTDRVPWQRAIMDCVTDPLVDEIYVQKSAQVGWTEILLNVLAYFIDADPSPLMYVMPTLELGEAFSKERLSPMLRDTDRIATKIADARARDSGNTLRNKTYHGGHLAIVGANSPASLRSRPIRILLADEIDAYPASAGAEGDPLKLAQVRQKTFWNRKTLGGSTPTIKGMSRIESLVESGDGRHFEFACVHCGAYQRFVWSQVKWSDLELAPEDAVYQCVHCGDVMNDSQRIDALATYRVVAEREFKGIASFHINELMSPFSSMGEMAVSFIEARKLPETLQTWVNSVLGESWVDSGNEVKAEGLAKRKEPYGTDVLPGGILILTLGVDTQDDRLEAQLIGWGKDEESWIIEQRVFEGDPGGRIVWRDLTEYRMKAYVTEDSRTIRAQATCVDAGGHFAQQVYAYCHAFRLQHVFAIKGIGGTGRLIWPMRPGKTKLNPKAKVYSIGVDTIKDVLYPRLARVIAPGPGYIHLPAKWDDELSEQLTSERKVYKQTHGRRVGMWKPKKLGQAQEAQDCWNYGYAGLKSAEARGISLVKLSHAVDELHRTQLSQQLAEPPTLPPTPEQPPPKPGPKPDGPKGKRKLRTRQSSYLRR